MDDNAGGLGGPESIRDIGTRDTRLIERAIREEWPIPVGYRKGLVDRQARIAADPGSSPREATSAFRALVAANQQNIDVNRESVGTTVNVGVAVNNQMPASLENASDDALIDYLVAAGVVERPRAADSGEAPRSAGIVPAHTNGKTNGVSGRH